MGVQERRERERKQRQELIVSAAERVFFDKGLSNASMDDVSVASEMSKGALYLYFKNKDDLYYAIVHRGLSILFEMVASRIADGCCGLESLANVGRAYLEFYEKYPEYYRAILHQEIHEGPGENGAVCPCKQQCDETTDRLYTELIRVVERGIEDGSIRPDLDPIKLSVALWGWLTGLMHVLSKKSAVLERHLASGSGDYANEAMLETSIALLQEIAASSDRGKS